MARITSIATKKAPGPYFESFQHWRCHKCGANGRTGYLVTDDPISVVDRIWEAHAIADIVCHEKNGGVALTLGEREYA
jgi:hypothetical protein